MADSKRDRFAEQGFLGPVRVLSTAECKHFMKAVAEDGPPLDWSKGHAASSYAFYQLASHPAIVEPVAELLGDNVMLWGASIQRRPPGGVHAWHCDIETADPSVKAVSVWIGLENTNADSSLLIVPYSHRLGLTVQEARQHAGKGRDEVGDDVVVAWAREPDERCHLLKTEVTDGEALIFEGKMWHSSRNISKRTRSALLLQYATPDSVIRIPDLNQLDWPFRYINVPRPPCLLLNGATVAEVNRFVPAPVPSTEAPTVRSTSRVFELEVPLPVGENETWKPYSMFKCSTKGLRSLSCHASVLVPNESPHPPHAHADEELIMLLDGEVDFILPDAPTSVGKRVRLEQRGDFAYYPTQFKHTLQTTSRRPASYLMFKWQSGVAPARSAPPLSFGIFSPLDTIQNSAVEEGFRTRVLFEGPTSYLRKLHCHASTLTPGAGYEPHIDAYDVAIVVLEGEVETLGERVGPYGVIFYRAGESHGLRNPGGSIAKYAVFEFHGEAAKPPQVARRNDRSLLAKMRDPNVWKGKAQQLRRRYLRRA